MKNENDSSEEKDQLAKSKYEILQMFLEETEKVRARYLEMEESEISEPTKKEAVQASLQSLRLSTVKRSAGFLNPEGLFIDTLFQYVLELGAAIDNIETAYRKTEEADIDEPTKKEAILHPLNILCNDLNKAVKSLK